MTTQITPEILRAITVLVEQEDAAEFRDTLEITARLRVNHPVGLIGAAEVLNPLLDIAVADPPAYQRILEFIDAKRKALGLPPLKEAKSTRFDKTEYMRAFMDQKRQRQRRAVQIENMARPERDALIGRSRMDFMDAQAAKWKVELDTRVDRSRQLTGGALSKEALTSIRMMFWQWVDDQLDQAEQAARDRIQRK